jgi:serine/threonine-protein kinase
VGSGERVVAGWILERRLGSGGYGEVWQARRRHVDLVRALKLIPIVDDAAFESWRHEIGRLEALNHPNVVRFYDADLVSDGAYRDYAWIATELCDRSLADTLRAGQRHVLTEPETEQMLEGMLAALAAAHMGGMVHRDLKPANILWHTSGTWKLCDFGTARLVPADATHPQTQIIGTSPYMSPAAHRGQQNRAADLYALGVTVHEALLGERLHRRPQGITDSEFIKLVLDTPPQVSSNLPPRWQTAVRALIGDYGVFDAMQLLMWFGATRGERPPARGMPVGAAAAAGAAAALAPATAATVARSAPNGNGQQARPALPPPPGSPGGPIAKSQPQPPSPSPAQAPGGTSATEIRLPGQGQGPGPGGDAAQGKVIGKDGKSVSAMPAPPSSPARQVRIPAPAPPPPHPQTPRPSPPAQQPQAQPRPQPQQVAARPPAPPQQQSSGGHPGQGQQHPPPSYGGWNPPRPDQIAPLGRRLVAVLVDAFLVLAGVLILQYDRVQVPANSTVDNACENLADQYPSCVTLGNAVYGSSIKTLFISPYFLVAMLVLFVLLQGYTGVTVGKLFTGLKVVGPDGKAPGPRRALIRTLFLAVDAFPYAVPLMGPLVAVCNKRRHRVGDAVAETTVIIR